MLLILEPTSSLILLQDEREIAYKAEGGLAHSLLAASLHITRVSSLFLSPTISSLLSCTQPQGSDLTLKNLMDMPSQHGSAVEH